LCVLLAGFFAGLARFAFLRFGSGELYPEYSTLRPDPLGTKALFESLARFENITVARQFESLNKFKADSKTTLLFLGTRGLPDSSQLMPQLQALARAGARVFISLNAISSITQEREQDRINRWRPPEEKTSEPIPPVRAPLRVKLIDPLKANTNRL